MTELAKLQTAKVKAILEQITNKPVDIIGLYSYYLKHTSKDMTVDEAFINLQLYKYIYRFDSNYEVHARHPIHNIKSTTHLFIDTGVQSEASIILLGLRRNTKEIKNSLFELCKYTDFLGITIDLNTFQYSMIP